MDDLHWRQIWVLSCIDLFLTFYQMYCPHCTATDTKVIDSRLIENGTTVRRRRWCEACDYRFTTFERRWMVEMFVIKKDGTKEVYNRQKIRTALTLSFAKRNYTAEQIEQFIDTLEIKRSYKGTEIAASRIGDDIMMMLKETDQVAYIRYASVYQAFDGVEDFRQIVK